MDQVEPIYSKDDVNKNKFNYENFISYLEETIKNSLYIEGVHNLYVEIVQISSIKKRNHYVWNHIIFPFYYEVYVIVRGDWLKSEDEEILKRPNEIKLTSFDGIIISYEAILDEERFKGRIKLQVDKKYFSESQNVNEKEI